MLTFMYDRKRGPPTEDEIENTAGKVEWVVALLDEADGHPASWSCLAFLLGTHFHKPMETGCEERGERRR